ncbi:anthrax toxin lethal factor-related metalloendopeptidase [Bacillus testis]|uniref:anthrax toxin lethal factor-related metalloendopeptidase n=1 Tax=Bacillus testis TaxID=1622072 RepID=UPI000840FF71|nr:hypothetical protein [Bacillus testis]
MKRMPIKAAYLPLMLTLALAFSLMFSPAAFAAAVDYSDNHTFQNETVKKLVEVLDDDNQYDVAEAQKMIDRVSKINEKLLSETQKAGIRLILTDFPLTDLPEWSHLKGVVPRGWEGTGKTWDDVPGIGGNPTAARIGYSDYGRGHTTVNLELHEFSHAIDFYAAGLVITELEEFLAIHEEEYEPLFHDHTVFYYFAYPEEYFAEAMALYHLNAETKAKLLERAPKTYAFIETLPQRIISVDQTKPSYTSFSWVPVAGAAKYEVYRDGQLLKKTNKPQYTDTHVKAGMDYSYQVKAIGSNGKVLNTTFSRFVSTLAEPTPGDPTGLAVKQETKTTVSLTWDQSEGADYYEILRDGSVIGTAKHNSYTDSRLEQNTTYTYSVKAVNESGASPGDNKITVTTDKDKKHSK